MKLVIDLIMGLIILFATAAIVMLGFHQAHSQDASIHAYGWNSSFWLTFVGMTIVRMAVFAENLSDDK